jgi:hypothetical protein
MLIRGCKSLGLVALAGWLAHVWLTQVKRLGLRYVARVVQADTHGDIMTLHKLMKLPFCLQYFMEATDAKNWSQVCRVADFT